MQHYLQPFFQDELGIRIVNGREAEAIGARPGDSDSDTEIPGHHKFRPKGVKTAQSLDPWKKILQSKKAIGFHGWSLIWCYPLYCSWGLSWEWPWQKRLYFFLSYIPFLHCPSLSASYSPVSLEYFNTGVPSHGVVTRTHSTHSTLVYPHYYLISFHSL